MKKSIFVTVLLGLFLVSTAVAVEPGDTLWTRTYGGSDQDYGESVQQTTDGGYIITGYTASFGAGSRDVWLIKTDANGDTVWTRTYGGSNDDWAHSVQQTTDGGYIIAGETNSFGAGSDDFYVVKTDSIGDTLWTRTYGGSMQEKSFSIQQTTDGGYIVAGYTYSFGAGSADVWLIKTDANGDTEWTKTYGGRSQDYGNSVRQTADGDYIVAGSTTSSGAGGYDFYLIKVDWRRGRALWSRTYGGSGYDSGRDVQQTTDGGYIIAGHTQSFGAGLDDFYLVKTDPDGDTLWTLTYGGDGYDWAYSVQQTTDSGYVVTGYGNSFGAGGFDVYLVKTDADGGIKWTRTYGGSGTEFGNCVQKTTDGNYIVAGYTNSFGAGIPAVYLVKVAAEASSGMELECETPSQWFCRGTNFPFKITVTNNTGGDVSGTLAFEGYSGYSCDSNNVVVTITKAKTYPPGVTEQYYYFKVPNVVEPGEYSASVSGTLGDVDLFCCMNTDIVQCGPWRMRDNSEWELVEVDRPEVALPMVPELHHNHPNPFNASTVIGYQLPVTNSVKLEVYNLLGEKVATLVDGEQEAGYKSVTWDASEVSSGLYFYKLTAGDFREVKRMTLLK